MHVKTAFLNFCHQILPIFAHFIVNIWLANRRFYQQKNLASIRQNLKQRNKTYFNIILIIENLKLTQDLIFTFQFMHL